MTWPESIETSVSASNQQALEADKPLLIATNTAEFSQNVAEWRTAGSWDTGADDTAAGYSGRRAYDRQPQNQTKATTAGTVFHLLFDLHTTATDPAIGDAATFDTVSVINHNLGTLLTGAETATIDVQISETSDFSSTTTIATCSSITTDERITWWSLRDSYKAYTGLRYLRIKITASTSISPPSIGQVILGRRRQISARPDVPYDDQSWESNATDFVSESGTITRYSRFSGARVFAPTWTPTGADGFSLDDVETLRSWFKDSGYGTKPFLYMDKPYTERNPALTGVTRNFHYVLAAPALNMPAEGPVLRTADFEFREIAPFKAGEV